MTTKVTASVLANTAITPGTYGGATQIPVVTIDQQGRATYAANSAVSAISIASSQVTGTFASGSITGLAASATTDTTSATNITSGTLPAARLPSTTVSAGNYGGTTQIPVVTIDSTGRATYAANVDISGISIATSQLSGTISSAQLASGAAVTNLGFTPYNSTNPSGYTSIPTGVVHMWPTSTAPTGYLSCAGAAVSRTTYASLFAVIGTTFGSGDGTTTFNLPNYTNRMPYGTTLGATGGSADAVVVSHTHTASSAVTDPGHVHYTYGAYGGGGNPGGSLNVNNPGGQNQSVTSASTGISVSTSITSAGVSGTNANLPPYLGINFIIKT